MSVQRFLPHLEQRMRLAISSSRASQPHKRPKSSIIRFQADQPNERWQADVTHWCLRGGREVEILNQIDDHSRMLVGSDAKNTFRSIGRRLPLPFGSMR